MLRDFFRNYRLLLRNVPSTNVTLFVLSVVLMNLLANKELVSLPYLALDCGITLSWVSFLCMDMITKRFGAKASIKISVFALACNLAVVALLWLVSLAPGHWGAYYSSGLAPVDAGLNATFGGSWYVVLGSSVSMLLSSVTNSLLNQFIGSKFVKDNFGTFAARSYTSTLVGQLVDNLTFAIIVSHTFFGWTWVQVLSCSVTGALVELLCEVVLSPIGFRVVRQWEREGVGQAYLDAQGEKGAASAAVADAAVAREA
ncbi:VUT family protein [Olsenella umbonata]|uniref:VUT family protein n=1 Tax=Parafannyhessea umbonata TaxID=604330 RepID=UPI001568B76F